jgi:hypothetical protein
MKLGKHMRFRLASFIVLFLSIGFSVAESQTVSLAGDWIGESICFGDNPSCHDEKVVYHISVDPSDSTKVKIAADKIVDGKPEFMGDILLKYDAAKQTLTGDLQSPRYRGVWEFTIKGNTIEGSLVILPDKKVGRRIRVTRKDAAQNESTMTNHATGTFEVKMTPQDDKSDDKTMGRMTAAKQWQGDLEGTSKGQMLSGGDVSTGSAGYVAIENSAARSRTQRKLYLAAQRHDDERCGATDGNSGARFGNGRTRPASAASSASRSKMESTSTTLSTVLNSFENNEPYRLRHCCLF